MINWFEKLFTGGVKVDNAPFFEDPPAWKDPYEATRRSSKNISEPVLGIIRAFKKNPKRFKFITDGHPVPDYFRQGPYAGQYTGNYFCVLDKETGEKFFCSVGGLAYLGIRESRTFISQFGNLCALGFSLKKSNKLVGRVNSEWLTEDESQLLVDVIGEYHKQRIVRAVEWYERKDSKEERASKINKALDLVSERNRLKEIYK